MEYDGEGFLYPSIDKDKCSSCGDCMKVCPVLNYATATERKEPLVFMAWSIDGKVRRDASSGGIFPVLANYVLSVGGSGCGAAFDEHFHLVQRFACKKEDCKAFSGSKYLQSDSRGIYRKTKELLDEGKTILFTGVPCQFRALHFFLGRDYDNLITCETLCHGVPSPLIFARWVEYLEKKYNSRIIAYNFRDKANGWNKLTVSIIYGNGKKRIYRARNCNFHLWFGKHLSLRLSCFKCICREQRRYADFTIGDFWGIEKFKPDLDTSAGVSVMVVNTEKGKVILESCHKNLYLEEVDFNKVFSNRNKIMLHNFDIPAERTCFMADFQSLPFDKMVEKYDVPGFGQLVFAKLKSMIRRWSNK